jgi:hypothetical protein
LAAIAIQGFYLFLDAVGGTTIIEVEEGNEFAISGLVGKEQLS